MHNINTQLFMYANSAAGHYAWLDWSFVFLTTYFVQAVFVIVGLYMVVWYPLVETPPSFLRVKRLIYSLEMCLALGTTYVIVKALKILIAYPRPFETLLNSQLLVSIKGGDSFPSGHAALTMALATTVYLRHKKLGVLLYAFALMVAFSRLYVGVHYPLDVLVGMLIGLLVPTVFYRIFNT